MLVLYLFTSVLYYVPDVRLYRYSRMRVIRIVFQVAKVLSMNARSRRESQSATRTGSMLKRSQESKYQAQNLKQCWRRGHPSGVRETCSSRQLQDDGYKLSGAAEES